MWILREGAKGLYGGTSAPLVVGDLVITGVSGGDNGIRGFVAAYKAATGELAWKLYTIPEPGDTGPAADTWKGSALALGGGATWLTGSADTESNVLYWAVGNPHPDTDGDERIGSNLYTNSDLAIDVKTGKMLWYYQFTPHDLHDWDANEPIVLVDAKWKGQDRKLLLHANRNGFLYVLDRTTGKPLLAAKMVNKLNWASGIKRGDLDAATASGQRNHRAGNGDLSRGARRHQLVFNGLQSRHASVLRDDGGGLHHLRQSGRRRLSQVQQSRRSRAEDSSRLRHRNW